MFIRPISMMRKAAHGDPYGPELITNPLFVTADNWSFDPGWSWDASGKAVFDSVSGDGYITSNQMQFEAGKSYIITVNMLVGTTTGVGVYIGVVLGAFNSDGDNSLIFTASETAWRRLKLRSTIGYGEIYSASVKEIL